MFEIGKIELISRIYFENSRNIQVLTIAYNLFDEILKRDVSFVV
jgi:hypothetical protein